MSFLQISRERAESLIKVQLEVTTKCNSNCSYCPRDQVIRSGKRQVKDVGISFFEKIVENLLELRRKEQKQLQVSISGLGEPLLYKNLIEAINIIRRLLGRIHIRVNSNSHYLKGETADKLITRIDSLTCSLNMATEELYKEYRHNLDYQTAKQNIIDFLRKKGNRRPSVRLRINAFDVNKPHMGKVRRFWSKHLNPIDMISLGGFSNWAGKIDREKFVKRKLPPRKICHYLWGHVTVNLDGEVFPCCMGASENSESNLYLGNIKNQPLTELYNGEKHRHLRVLHRKKEYPPPCDVCDSWGSTHPAGRFG